MNEHKLSKIAVVGAGCWGTALSLVLSRQGDSVVLWTREADQAEMIQRERINHPLLGEHIPLSSNVLVTTCLEKVLECDAVLMVIPSSAMRSMANVLRQAGLPPHVPLISCTKGIELGTFERMTQILHDAMPENPLAVISGPNHAEEVAMGKPSASVVGCEDAVLARCLQERMSGPLFRLYSSTDVPGMELGGAIKNVFAIAAGICEGLDLGDNARAGLVTRALAEMTRLGIRLGGRPETFTGLSGIGDLMVTCYSHHSRNNTVGRYLAQGLSVDEALSKLGSVAEGVLNSKSIYEMAKSLDVRTPLIDTTYSIIYEGKKPQEALQELFLRDLRSELD